MTSLNLFPVLAETIAAFKPDELSRERKNILQPLINYIKDKRMNQQEVHLIFICTHNSRRSQLVQIWAQTAADYYGIPVHCYSGGTEVTAFNPVAVGTIVGAGFSVTRMGGDNPVYTIQHSPESKPIRAYSKLFDDAENKAETFAAVMTCSQADKHCPFIPGAEVRIPVWYEDPKEFDGTPLEKIKYEERSNQIGVEMFYVFSTVTAGLLE
jgi:arsenate reductase